MLDWVAKQEERAAECTESGDHAGAVAVLDGELQVLRGARDQLQVIGAEYRALVGRLERVLGRYRVKERIAAAGSRVEALEREVEGLWDPVALEGTARRSEQLLVRYVGSLLLRWRWRRSVAWHWRPGW